MNRTRGIVLIAMALGLAGGPALHSSPEVDVLTIYYAGCPRSELAAGWQHRSCWGTTSSGQLSGHWKEVEINDCEGGNTQYRFYEWCGGNWVEVSASAFNEGVCSCS
jgi:hypothetical protein